MNRLTETEKNQANALAGGDFEKLLAEFELIQTNFGKKKCTTHPLFEKNFGAKKTGISAVPPSNDVLRF